MKAARPSDLELDVLAVLWKKSEGTVRDVLESMPDGKKRAYTTILSVLQGMERKGLVRHTSRGTAHVYHPAVSRSGVLGPMLQKLVRNVFGNSPSTVLQCMLDEAEVSGEELARIREVIEAHEDMDDASNNASNGECAG